MNCGPKGYGFAMRGVKGIGVVVHIAGIHTH